MRFLLASIKGWSTEFRPEALAESDTVKGLLKEHAIKKQAVCSKCGKRTFWFFKEEDTPLCAVCKIKFNNKGGELNVKI